MVVLYIIFSVLLVSLISVLAIIPYLFKRKIDPKMLLLMLSLSVGTLFGAVFLHFLPEISHEGYSLINGLHILLGVLVFFMLEKFVHWHHHKCKDEKHDHKPHDEPGHGHAYHLAPINLIGDGIHNFLDGILIAGSYIVSIPLGIAATVSVIFHEVPQEVADFGVLLYSGMSRMKAVILNLLSALTALIGAGLGLLLAGNVAWFEGFILPFAAGSFIYIAGSNLLPELHKHCHFRESVVHLFMIIIGILIMVLVETFTSGLVH
jgi:zinc and cadmium transporter